MRTLLTAMLVLFAMPAIAQTNYTYTPQSKNVINKGEGFKIAIVQSFFDNKFTAEGSNGETNKEDFTADQTIGLSFGYQNIQPYDLGYNLLFTYKQLKDDDEEESHTIGSIRLESNLTYALNDFFYIAGGLNIHKYTEELEFVDVALGYQAGIGAIYQNFNISLLHYTVRNTTEYSYDDGNGNVDVETELKQSGVELAVGMTF